MPQPSGENLTKPSALGGLLGPVAIRALAEELDVSPTKKLGQNFVHDAGTVRKIAALAKITDGESVLEVGPGLGSLTLALLECGASVTAIELDPRLANRLSKTVSEFNAGWADKLDVVNLDALRTEPHHADNPVALVANLPYNVSVPVLLHILGVMPSIRRVVVMVQKEVAERLCAKPGSRVYGAPSVKLAWYGNARLAGVVGRKVFWPEPNVDSALVAATITSPARGSETLRATTFDLVDAAFGQRRKMLRSSLKGVIGQDHTMDQVFAQAGIEPTVRPENLGIEDFVRLAETLLETSSRQ